MPKLIVDSSIWIDFFNKKISSQTSHLKGLLITNAETSPIIILPVIMQEVLQGIENNLFFNVVKENLQGLDYLDYGAYEIAIRAAQLYRHLRKKGITINKANDCLIATFCIEFNIPLLHNDKDFNNIAKHTSLKIYKY
jgi:predicted nucleic acid-binding protein